MVLHGTRFDELHKVVPKDMLPPQYGGPAGPPTGPAGFQYPRWAAKLRALAGYFTGEAGLCCRERSLRSRAPAR